MTRSEIESRVIQELHRLLPEKVEELLDFALFLRSRVRRFIACQSTPTKIRSTEC